tara:strand:- start:4228 stop:4971 length:744 start_codon:yes stop_codon:yes gene_type:complete
MNAMITAYRWDANWKTLLFVLLVIPILIKLGFWQLERADEKLALQARYAQQQLAPPVPLSTLAFSEELAYKPVYILAEIDNDHTVLLDNRIYDGQVGYQVLSPALMQNGQAVLVNRGWIAGFLDRRRLPEVPPIIGQVRLLGNIYLPLGEAVILAADQWSNQWPLVVQWVDIERLELHLGRELLPLTVRLQADSKGALTADWPTVNVKPEKHRGYALQWFIMALALLLFWLYSSIRPEASGSKQSIQ